ncbi:MAG: hypothetical protein COZ69_11950 [Deltaproteobacteria bacterium CG_4_8_14_3_um_filter_45_9]|nr:MAG: hypothetical protein COS40_15250 [Deltaproteobacteria bacterium CG03_land_8_20_14_0_80_45_14]PIX22092.1 MAG: hypothetical protein COZ69_11950 [Deltaproteobacteria bacterium CG_4_8_14_3_um_filter_45_9]
MRNGSDLKNSINPPHHPEITSHPHHKHISDNVIPAKEPSLKDVLDEIGAIIIGKPVSVK